MSNRPAYLWVPQIVAKPGHSIHGVKAVSAGPFEDRNNARSYIDAMMEGKRGKATAKLLHYYYENGGQTPVELFKITPEQAAAYFAASNMALAELVWSDARGCHRRYPEPVDVSELDVSRITCQVLEAMADNGQSDDKNAKGWKAEWKQWLKEMKKPSDFIIGEFSKMGFEIEQPKRKGKEKDVVREIVKSCAEIDAWCDKKFGKEPSQ